LTRVTYFKGPRYLGIQYEHIRRWSLFLIRKTILMLLRLMRAVGLLALSGVYSPMSKALFGAKKS